MSEFKNLLNPGAPRPPRWRWLERPWKMAAGVLVGLLALYVVIATVRFLAWGEEDAFIEWFNELASQPLGSFQFASPRWLLWLVPAWVACLVITHYSVAGLRIWRRRFVLMVRLVVVTLAILILAELQWVTFTDNLSVVFVIDHSRSVPEALQTKALEYVNQAVKTKEADDRAGLVYFGGQAYPMTSLNNLFSVDSRVKPDIKDDSTNIARALQTAQSMFPRGARRRIVLFTDGRETVGDVLEQVKRMHHENIRIDVVPLIHPMQGEVIAEKLDMPSVVNSDQPFDARLYVNNVNGKPVDVNIMLQLKTSEGNAVPVFRAPIRYTLAPGMNAIPIPDLKNKEPSFYRYEAIIKAVRPEDDTIVENNTVYGSTQIKGESKVLILVGRAYDGANWRSQDVKPLDDALKAEGIFTDVRYAGMDVGDKLPKTLEDLQNFDCFILMNISKEDLSDAMVPMKTCVNDLGCGLIMLGGRDSFGAGGYLHTPIEEILPVSCETEDKQVMMNGALVVVLHTCEFEQGNMWAVKIAKVCVDTLSVGDWYGVMEYAWSAGSNWVVPLARITSKAGLKQQIDKANPGDMPDFNSVVADADAALSKIPAKVGAKRIVIISDGDPSPPMPTTMQNLKDHGISMSFVGIQPHGGNEISNMQALSKMTGGNYYFCLDVDHLPRIFQHEAAIVRQQLVVENPDGFTPLRTDELDPARLIEGLPSFPKTYGLNRTRRRDVASNSQVLLEIKLNEKETALPLLAYRRVGLGKTVAFTGDLTGAWGRDWIAQEYHRKLWGEIVRKVSRAASSGTHTVRLTNDGGECKVNVEARDSKGEFVNFAKVSGSVVDPDLESVPGVTFVQDGAGSYVAKFPMTKTGTYRVFTRVVNDDGQASSALTGISYSYPEEFKEIEVNDKKLDQITSKEFGNGRRLDLAANPALANVFDRKDMDRGEDVKDLKDTMIWVLLALVLVDVFFRRVYLDFDSLAVWCLVQAAKVLPFLRGTAQASLNRMDTLTPALQSARQQLTEQQAAAQAARRKAILEKIEKEGGSGDFNLDLDAANKDGLGSISGPAMQDKIKPGSDKPAQSASEYTNRLLQAKRRAKKDLDNP